MKNQKDTKPLYHKLSEEICSKIEEGIWPVGSKIPSERQLVEDYNLSRITVRNAITECVNQGKLEKVHGKGTYVVNSKILQNLKNVYSFSEEMKKQGKVSSTKINCCVVIDASETVAKKLGIKTNSAVIFLERLRYAGNDKPIIIEKSYFPFEEYKFLLTTNLDNVSLYKTLEREHKVVIDRAVEVFQACKLRPSECRLLDCEKDYYGLLIKRIAYSDDKVVSYSTIISKNDVFEFTIELKA